MDAVERRFTLLLAWHPRHMLEVTMKQLVAVTVILAALAGAVGTSVAAERQAKVPPMPDQAEAVGTAS